MKRVLKYVLKYKILVILPFIVIIISTILDMFNPYLQKVMVDKVIIGKEGKLFLLVLGGLGGVTIIRCFLGYLKEITCDYLGSYVSADLKKDLFDHIQSLPFSYFDDMNTGELMSRIGEDIDNIWMSIAFGIGLFIENLMYFVISASILFFLNWKLAIICLIPMPFLCYFALKLEREVGASYEKISDQAAVINTTAQENIAGVRLVKAFAREKFEILKFLKLNNINYRLKMDQNTSLSKYLPAIDFLTNISALLVVIIGGILVIMGNITLGTLVAFNSYIWMLVWPMRNLGWLTNVITQGNESAKKIFKILDVEPLIKDSPSARAFDNIKGHVEFKNVSFKYKDIEVLKEINIDARPGTTTAIMGTTGSGKSSLINLIGRFYDVSTGNILLDDVDIKDIKLKNLRGSIAVVSQDTFLFSESVEENIRMGNDYIYMEDIHVASNDACAEEFIDELEDKYDTLIGERGIGLSGGQKQRISISRALIRDASILILDDATSALDMDTEYNLLKNLHNKNDKVTTFIIAHRISAVKNADEIVFLEEGEIVERGTHDELLKLEGKYYDIYCDQFKEFVELEKEVV